MATQGDGIDVANPATSVPVGLSTKIGGTVSAVMGLVAVLTAVLDGDHTTETIGALASAVVVLVTLMGGRYAQAAARFKNVLTPQERALIAQAAAAGLDRLDRPSPPAPPVRPVR